MRLATFIHLSDLHFGEPPPEYYPLLRSLSGFFNDNWGHDQRTCEVLEKFIDQRRNEQVGFIITGDLTNYGHPSQFKLVTDYLSLSPTADQSVCLGLTDWKENTISGNHDCWPGRPFPFIQGSRTLACSATFRQHPYWNKIVELSSGHRLHFIGIDTDSDVSFGDKLCARGAFETQLQTLATQLPDPEENDEVRILLLHHSCLPAPGKIGHEIKRESQEALYKFLLKHRIAVLLSGHLHEPCIKTVKLPVSNSETSVSVLEARCGTTTQRTGKPILRQMGPFSPDYS